METQYKNAQGEGTLTDETGFNRRKQALFAQYYRFLNPPQREAVSTVKGPLLVLAGAGSGKTTVLVNRIGNIILFGDAWKSTALPPDAETLYGEMAKVDGGSRSQIRAVLEKLAVEPAAPYRVLCITFTNKAANECKERLSALLGERAKDIWAGTFHSICVRILRRHVNLLGFTGNFTIYDADDTKKIVTAVMKKRHIDEKLLSVKAVTGLISQFKEKGYLPDDLEDDDEIQGDARLSDAAGVYRDYQRTLQDANALDFDDLILYTNLLFRKYPEVLERYRRQFSYILVDEFQDTNPAQNLLIAQLGGGHGNVCVVGDDDQSIYSFRGATVENILHFDDLFPDARIIRLEQNYRSTGHILSAANAVIRHNSDRKGKNLWTDAGEGERIRVERPMTQAEESALVVREIKRQVADGSRRYGDFAVLYRVGALSNAIEQALVKARIPYRICGGLRFSERREIKDAVAYLSVVNNPSDGVRLRRILNVPRRAIGDTTADRAETIALAEGKSLYDIIRHAGDYPVLSRAAGKLTAFGALIDRMRAFAAGNGLTDTVSYVLEESGYLRFLAEEAEADGDDLHEREQNVQEFLSTVRQYEETSETPTLPAFLEEMALISDADALEEGQDAVTLMTVHAAKGLEFPSVFVIGFEDGLFPSQQAILEGGIEEERRLAYVAITRAKQSLCLTHCAARMLYGRTDARVASRFLAEIPEADRVSSSPKPPYARGPAFTGARYANLSSDSQQASGGQPVFSPGDRVVHPMFGAGEVLTTQEVGGDVLYSIRFDDGAEKRIMGSFARLKRET